MKNFMKMAGVLLLGVATPLGILFFFPENKKPIFLFAKALGFWAATIGVTLLLGAWLWNQFEIWREQQRQKRL